MNREKQAQPAHRIHELLASRWSPYSFADKNVAGEDLLGILEAARWAPSSYNEQPWRYILARRSEGAGFEKLLSCLVEGNQAWAKYAPVLLIGVAMTRFARNGKVNKAAAHDLGLAAGNMSVEATARGLHVHQMIGIVPERVRKLYDLPEDAEPFTAIAIGYLGDGKDLTDALRERDGERRERRPVSEFVFGEAWQQPARLPGPSRT